MNQIIKDVIYTKGSVRQVEFLADLGGMNEEEKSMFFLMHEGKTDLYIQEELDMSKKSFERVQESVRAKLMLAVFECINGEYFRRK